MAPAGSRGRGRAAWRRSAWRGRCSRAPRAGGSPPRAAHALADPRRVRTMRRRGRHVDGGGAACSSMRVRVSVRVGMHLQQRRVAVLRGRVEAQASQRGVGLCVHTRHARAMHVRGCTCACAYAGGGACSRRAGRAWQSAPSAVSSTSLSRVRSSARSRRQREASGRMPTLLMSLQPLSESSVRAGQQKVREGQGRTEKDREGQGRSGKDREGQGR